MTETSAPVNGWHIDSDQMIVYSEAGHDCLLMISTFEPFGHPVIALGLADRPAPFGTDETGALLVDSRQARALAALLVKRADTIDGTAGDGGDGDDLGTCMWIQRDGTRCGAEATGISPAGLPHCSGHPATLVDAAAASRAAGERAGEQTAAMAGEHGDGMAT